LKNFEPLITLIMLIMNIRADQVNQRFRCLSQSGNFLQIPQVRFNGIKGFCKDLRIFFIIQSVIIFES